MRWVAGDLSNLEGLGLEPGYSFVYDMGCIHGLPDGVRTKVAAGITALAGPDATLVLLAFKAARRLFLPRGMDEDEIRHLFADDWTLVEIQSWTGPAVPLPIRRAQPNLYRLTRADRS